jgi:hypothetical protein
MSLSIMNLRNKIQNDFVWMADISEYGGRVPNRLTKTITQILAGHWLSASYLKGIRTIYVSLSLIITGGMRSSGCIASPIREYLSRPGLC